MAFTEKPPMLKGSPQQQISTLRDYLFRMAKGLEETAAAATAGKVVSAGGTGGESRSSDTAAIEAVRKNAQELQALIIKTANDLTDDINNGDAAVMQYADQKTEQYDSMYVAKSEFGEFTETINTTIETTARGVVDSYNYGSAIHSQQDEINLLQNYMTSVNGEIRRGIIEDPDDPGNYVTGIAISQNLQFSAECGPADEHNPGDGYTYYYLNAGQTFGLYTSTGWQFWIEGEKVGWFSSLDGMLHVGNVYVESELHIGAYWVLRQTVVTGGAILDINFVV